MGATALDYPPLNCRFTGLSCVRLWEEFCEGFNVKVLRTDIEDPMPKTVLSEKRVKGGGNKLSKRWQKGNGSLLH